MLQFGLARLVSVHLLYGVWPAFIKIIPLSLSLSLLYLLTYLFNTYTDNRCLSRRCDGHRLRRVVLASYNALSPGCSPVSVRRPVINRCSGHCLPLV